VWIQWLAVPVGFNFKVQSKTYNNQGTADLFAGGSGLGNTERWDNSSFSSFPY